MPESKEENQSSEQTKMAPRYIEVRLTRAYAVPDRETGLPGFKVFTERKGVQKTKWVPAEDFHRRYMPLGNVYAKWKMKKMGLEGVNNPINEGYCSSELIDQYIDKQKFHVVSPRTVVLLATLMNGFEIVTSASSQTEENTDVETLKIRCMAQARHRVVDYLNFLLHCARFGTTLKFQRKKVKKLEELKAEHEASKATNPGSSDIPAEPHHSPGDGQ